MLAKINFFVCIAKVLIPYLELFQTDKPMMPYISDELLKVLINLLSSLYHETCIKYSQEHCKNLLQ